MCKSIQVLHADHLFIFQESRHLHDGLLQLQRTDRKRVGGALQPGKWRLQVPGGEKTGGKFAVDYRSCVEGLILQ